MSGKLVTLFPGSTPVWDIAGDGSQGYCKAVAVIAGGGGGGSGTVTSVSSPNSTLSIGTPTTTPTLDLNLNNPNTWVGIQTFTTPVLGAATATSINKVTLTAPATGSTLTIADGVTLTANTTGTVAVLGAANAFTLGQSITLTDTGTNTAPTLVTLDHESNQGASIAAGFGSTWLFKGSNQTVNNVTMAAIKGVYLTTVNASFGTQIQFQTVSNAGALSTGLTVGSGISGATAGLIIGGWGSSAGGIWYSGQTPSTTNVRLYCDNGTTILNVQTGGSLNFDINSINFAAMSSTAWTQTLPSTTTITAIGTAATAGNTLVNTTVAAAGAQQYSPALQLSGQGWKTTATAGSQQCDWQIQCVPVQNTTTPTATLVFSSQVNAGGFGQQLTIGSGILGATAGLIIGGYNTTNGGIWASGVVPTTLNFAFSAAAGSTTINAPSGGLIAMGINSSIPFQLSATVFVIPKVTTYNAVATAGIGVPAIYGLDNRTGLTSADGAPVTLYTSTGANQLYRVMADIFATAAVTGTANYTITWTENSTTQTATVSATAINVLGTNTQLIRPDNATNITVQLLGTFTGTFSVASAVERIA